MCLSDYLSLRDILLLNILREIHTKVWTHHAYTRKYKHKILCLYVYGTHTDQKKKIKMNTYTQTVTDTKTPRTHFGLFV